MIQVGDIVVVQSNDYPDLEQGMELVVTRAKLKAESIHCTRANRNFLIKRSDLVRRDNPRPDLAKNILGQSIEAFREKRHPTESLMTGGARIEFVRRR
jgi:hypothetical protein